LLLVLGKPVTQGMVCRDHLVWHFAAVEVSPELVASALLSEVGNKRFYRTISLTDCRQLP